MKNTLTNLHRSGGRSRTGRWFQRALVTAALLIAATGAQAQILINLGVNPTIDFTASPLNTAEWATQDNIQPGDGATYGSPAALDAAAQLIDQSVIVTPLSVVTANGAIRVAGQNTTSGTIFTQPTGVPTAVIKATLQNNSGGNINVLKISYSYTIPVAPVTDNVPGQRVFWSLTGTPGDWHLIPELSGVTAAGTLNATVGAGAWGNGTPLYLMWLDDNNQNGTDGSFHIDDIVFTGEVASAIAITDDPDSITVDERAPASFTVVATGSPQFYYWLSNGVPIDGAHSATYTLPSAPFSASGVAYSVIVSNGFNSVTSAGATLTVTADTTPPAALSAVSSTDQLQFTVTFSEPVVVGDPSSFSVYPTGTDPQMTAFSPFTFSINGNDVLLTLSAPLADGVDYSVDIYEIYDTSVGTGGNLIDPYPTTLPIRRNLLLVDFDGPNNVWKYSTETNLFEVDPSWATVGYDDSAWPSGPAALGRDANVNGVDIRTATYPQSDGANTSAPQFYRKTVFLPASTAGVTLTARHVFEDGGVIFINGQEAGRFNVGAGTLSAATRSTANATDPLPISSPVSLPTTNLVAGNNVIAVVVVQSGATSSDSVMALELAANFGTFAAGPPVVDEPPQSQVVNEGASVALTVSASGALPLTYQWRKGGNNLNGETNAVYSILSVVPADAGNYDVLVSNSLDFATSATATLTVTADTTAPAFVSAVGSTNLTNITLTIYDGYGLNVAQAEDEGNYTVQLAAGGGALTIESAVLVNSSNVLLTTSARTQSQSYNVTLGNIRDISVAANLVTPSTRPLLGGIVVLAPNDTTQWLYDNSSNSLDGLGWELPGYNTAGWLSGLAGFANRVEEIMPAGGFDTRTLTLIPVNVGGPQTVYFRVPFNFPGNPAGAQLRLVGVVDDGLVAYINGVEAGRIRITNDAPVLFDALATAASPEATDVHGMNEVLLDTSALVQGNNLLAISSHQNSLTSSDVALSIQLVGEIAEFTPVGPTLTISYSGGDVTVTWSGGGTLQQSTDLSSPANWVNVPGSPTSPYTTTASGPFRFFQVVQP